MTDVVLDQTGLGPPPVAWPAADDDDTSARTGTGSTTLELSDGSTYLVAHSAAEVQTKIANPSTGTNWVAFDLLYPFYNENTVVIDVTQVVGIA